MSKIKGDTEITTEYVNNKLEQVLSALFDTLEHTNDKNKKDRRTSSFIEQGNERWEIS